MHLLVLPLGIKTNLNYNRIHPYKPINMNTSRTDTATKPAATASDDATVMGTNKSTPVSRKRSCVNNEASTLEPGGGRERKRFKGAIESTEHSRTSKSSGISYLLCPLSSALPFEPAMAEDGMVYERRCILNHFATCQNNIHSPVTKAPMGKTLISAIQVRNNIAALVESGTVPAILADAWKKLKSEQEKFAAAMQKARNGDAAAMFSVANWYWNGKISSVPQNKAEAFVWFKRAADQYHINPKSTAAIASIAAAGNCLLKGIGVERNQFEGLLLLGRAAELGSDYAAWCLGNLYYGKSDCLVPIDHTQAKYWYEKALSGSCGILHLNKAAREKAEACLLEIAKRSI